MKTILYIAPSITVKGGISTVIRGYLDSYIVTKYKILFVSSHVDGSKVKKLGIAILGLAKMVFLLSVRKIDIVHIHGGDILSLKRKYIYFKFLRFWRKKIIYHFHGAFFLKQYERTSKFWKKRVKKLLEGCDLVISISKNWRKSILEIAPNTKIEVLPNSLHLPSTGQSFGRHNHPVNLTFLGHIGDRKGIFDLLVVTKRLLDSGYELKLHVGGNGDIDRLKENIHWLGISSSVDYKGWLSEGQRNNLLRQTDIFVLPSYGEGMPMSILEAMSFGVPVISTEVGGIPEVVLDGQTGVLVKPGDIDTLYIKILELLLDRQKREQLGKNARILIQSKHDIRKNWEKLDKIYQSVGSSRK